MRQLISCVCATLGNAEAVSRLEESEELKEELCGSKREKGYA